MNDKYNQWRKNTSIYDYGCEYHQSVGKVTTMLIIKADVISLFYDVNDDETKRNVNGCGRMRDD